MRPRFRWSTLRSRTGLGCWKSSGTGSPARIVYIGGIVDPLFLFKNPSVALRVNVEETVNVLECIRQSAVERIVYYLQFVEPAVRGEKVRLASGGPLPRDYTHVRDIANLTAAVLDAPDDADRVFYAATGKPLVTAAQAAKLVMELVPGADIEIGDMLSEDDEVELGFRGVLSIENARRQLE
jgi:nucleoside-diphosphate-sugar epimerase